MFIYICLYTYVYIHMFIYMRVRVEVIVAHAKVIMTCLRLLQVLFDYARLQKIVIHVLTWSFSLQLGA